MWLKRPLNKKSPTPTTEGGVEYTMQKNTCGNKQLYEVLVEKSLYRYIGL